MKATILLITAAIAVSGAFSIVSAQSPGDDKFTTLQHPQARISIDTNNLVAITFHCQFEEKCRNLLVRILDETGYMVYFCNLKKQGSVRIRIDPSHLSDGEYDFEFYVNDELNCSKGILKETLSHTHVLMSAL